MKKQLLCCKSYLNIIGLLVDFLYSAVHAFLLRIFSFPSIPYLSWILRQTGLSKTYIKSSYVIISFITKTCLYTFDPLKPHFYIVKLGFTGVYIIFLISAKNINCGYSLEPPLRGGSNEYPQSIFWADIWKISEYFYLQIFSFCRWNFHYIWIGVFS